MAITSKRKDKESVERLMRRFQRDVNFSKILQKAREKMQREEKVSREVKPASAIRRKKRFQLKIKELIS